MFVIDIIFALLIAFLFVGIIGFGLNRTGPWQSIWTLFLIIFLAAWAGGLWIMPFGPILFGGYIFPFLFAGLLIALVLGVTIPTEPTEYEIEKTSPPEEREAAKALDVFFWVIIGLLVVFVVFGYFFPAVS
ncbi:MAG: hypothetical protein ACLFR1_15345 [Spirochaetia bacterium]